MPLQSKINDSTDDNSNKNVAKSDPKSDPLVYTHTSDRKKQKSTDTDTTKQNSPHKLLKNREIPVIIQDVILPVNQTSAGGVTTSVRALHAVRAVFYKDIVTVATCSAAGVLKDTPVINWKDMGETIPVDRNTVGITPRTTTQVQTGIGPSVPPSIIGSQKVEDPRQSIIPQEVRNANPLNASINRILAKHRDPTPSWSKLISSKTFTNKSAGVYARGWMNFRSDTVLSESPNFMDFGLLSVKK